MFEQILLTPVTLAYIPEGLIAVQLFQVFLSENSFMDVPKFNSDEINNIVKHGLAVDDRTLQQKQLQVHALTKIATNIHVL